MSFTQTKNPPTFTSKWISPKKRIRVNLSRKKSLGNNYRTAIIVAKLNIAFGYTRRKLNIFCMYTKNRLSSQTGGSTTKMKKGISQRYSNI